MTGKEYRQVGRPSEEARHESLMKEPASSRKQVRTTDAGGEGPPAACHA